MRVKDKGTWQKDKGARGRNIRIQETGDRIEGQE
jgi:hypothetical protein